MSKIINDAAGYLKDKDYRYIQTNRYEGFPSEDFTEACFFKPEGSVLNIVIMLNAHKIADTEERFEVLCHKITESLNINMKTICLGVAIGSPDFGGFTEKNDFDPQADIIRLRWAYDEEEKSLICPDCYPDEFDGLEKVFGKGYDKAAGRAEKNSKSYIRVRKPGLTYIIMAACIFVFALMCLDGGSTDENILIRFGALYAPYVKAGQYYRLFTYMFIHIGALHLFSNMFALYIFGVRCERYYGYVRLVFVYVISGLGCALMSLAFSKGAVSAGASGAIMGLISSALAYTAINRITMDGLDYYVYIIFSVINIGFGFLYPDVDNFGHIGGFIAGLLPGIIYGMADKRRALDNGQTL